MGTDTQFLEMLKILLYYQLIRFLSHLNFHSSKLTVIQCHNIYKSTVGNNKNEIMNSRDSVIRLLTPKLELKYIINLKVSCIHYNILLAVLCTRIANAL